MGDPFATHSASVLPAPPLLAMPELRQTEGGRAGGTRVASAPDDTVAPVACPLPRSERRSLSPARARTGAAAPSSPVHARADEEAPQLGRLAEDVGVVGREALGAIDELRAGGREHRQAVQRALHERLEVVPV